MRVKLAAGYGGKEDEMCDKCGKSERSVGESELVSSILQLMAGPVSRAEERSWRAWVAQQRAEREAEAAQDETEEVMRYAGAM